MNGFDTDCTAKVEQTLTRNHYFTGKMMTERDFAKEQEYFLSRKWLHNRLLHGVGTVCGLQVVLLHTEEGQQVVVTSGVAIDGCGREIILAEDVVLARPPSGSEMPEPLLVCIRYCEAPCEPIPAFYGPGETDAMQYNLILEKADILLLPLKEVDPRCWLGGFSYCLEESCSCDGLVPLAAIFSDDEGEFRVDNTYRQELPGPHQSQTRIEWVNWLHGGELSVERLRNEFRRRLMVRFSADLAENDRRTGINEFTFRVQSRDRQRRIETLPGRARLLEDRRTAVFTLAANQLQNLDGLINKSIEVTLKCDLIVDRSGSPADGSHLRGRLPTGNGTPGGDFFSWVRVVA